MGVLVGNITLEAERLDISWYKLDVPSESCSKPQPVRQTMMHRYFTDGTRSLTGIGL